LSKTGIALVLGNKIYLHILKQMIVIRKATSNDSRDIARYLFLAMEDLVYRFIGEANTAKASTFMLHFVERDNNQYSYQNCWVVEDNAKVLAAINVYDGALLGELRVPIIDYLKSEFNKDFDPEDETQAGEYYIDSFGVNPDQQGKGIGTKLLQFVIEEYAGRSNQTLGLLVDEKNPDAKRLYLRLGFKSVGKRILFGVPMEHLQLKK
jgi:ribosomal protein S18 acetylase RimI-like enzyme